MSVGELSAMFADAVRDHFSPISPDNTMWDGEDRQYVQQGELLYELIQEDWEVFADEREQLLEDILDAGWTKDDPDWPTASGTEWTRRDIPFRDRADALADTWEEFCREVNAEPSTIAKLEAVWGERLSLVFEDVEAALPQGYGLYRAQVNKKGRKTPRRRRNMNGPSG